MKKEERKYSIPRLDHERSKKNEEWGKVLC